jgi:hypothetical protein
VTLFIEVFNENVFNPKPDSCPSFNEGSLLLEEFN